MEIEYFFTILDLTDVEYLAIIIIILIFFLLFVS